MTVLTDIQIKNGYFDRIGGFPPHSIIREVKEYNGGDHLCIACTQLDYLGYSEREKKRILAEWIDFLWSNRKLFRALHFVSRVPQTLFEAACCQENLEELRFKWGAYTDLSALGNLKKLKFLYIGSGASIHDLAPLTNMEHLVVLYVENFKRIEDYTPLMALHNLEQLVISGPILGNTPIKDLEFLRDMHSLVSVWLPNTTWRRKYTASKLESLREALPNLYDINGCIWGRQMQG